MASVVGETCSHAADTWYIAYVCLVMEIWRMAPKSHADVVNEMSACPLCIAHTTRALVDEATFDMLCHADLQSVLAMWSVSLAKILPCTGNSLKRRRRMMSFGIVAKWR